MKCSLFGPILAVRRAWTTKPKQMTRIHTQYVQSYSCFNWLGFLELSSIRIGWNLHAVLVNIAKYYRWVFPLFICCECTCFTLLANDLKRGSNHSDQLYSKAIRFWFYRSWNEHTNQIHEPKTQNDDAKCKVCRCLSRWPIQKQICTHIKLTLDSRCHLCNTRGRRTYLSSWLRRLVVESVAHHQSWQCRYMDYPLQCKATFLDRGSPCEVGGCPPGLRSTKCVVYQYRDQGGHRRIEYWQEPHFAYNCYSLWFLSGHTKRMSFSATTWNFALQ